uniref:Uncharacterized protein n=1 Tax=Sipha flava TaxID=143950 RepID=A0A2S2QUU6_9HEMI
MLIIFIDIKGLNYYNFFSTGGRVNQTYYIKVLIKLQEIIRIKGADQLQNRSWLLHHDNALLILPYQFMSFWLINKFQTYHNALTNRPKPLVIIFYFQKLKLTSKNKDFMILEQLKKRDESTQTN